MLFLVDDKMKTVLRVGRQARKSAVDTDDASETSTGPEDDYSQYEDLFTAVSVLVNIFYMNLSLKLYIMSIILYR